MILSRRILKRVGESKQPCLTPTEVLNQSPMLLLKHCTGGFVIELLDHCDKVDIDAVQPHSGQMHLKIMQGLST